MNRAAAQSPVAGVGGRGKTMKEYEDELTELRRDNFDLRMRIYLMEEHNATTTGPDDSTMSADFRTPSTFAAMKDLYLSNKSLKAEVENLKEKLAQKESDADKAAHELVILKRDTAEQIDSMQEAHKQETEQLTERISDLSKELVNMENVLASWKLEIKEVSVMNDTASMAAMAFNLLQTPGNSQPSQSSGRLLDYNDIFALECQIAMLEKDLKEERRLRMESDMALDAARGELQESESARSSLAIEQARLDEKARALMEQLAVQEKELDRARTMAMDTKLVQRLHVHDDESSKSLQEQLAMREQELATAHRIIEEKCLAVDSLGEMLNRLRMSPSSKGRGDYKHSGEGLSDLEKQVVALSQKLESRDNEIDSLRRENVKALRTIQGFIKQNKALNRDLEELRQRHVVPDDKKVDFSEKDVNETKLLKQVESLTEELNCLKNALGDDEKNSKDAAGLIMSLRADLDVKKNEVEVLNEELRKRTFNLQELVNKELWDKNREIEKLNKACERKQLEVGNLKKEIITMTDKLKSLTQAEGKENENPNANNRISDKSWEELRAIEEENWKMNIEVDLLRGKFKEQLDKSEKLKKDVDKYRADAEESEKSRKELVNACTLLTTRLEELASFLESLLPSLGSCKRRIVQQAIDRSREMSRSFSFLDRSNLSVPILPDVSQVEFCSGDESLRIELKEPESEVVHLKSQVDSFMEKLKLTDSSGCDRSKMNPLLWQISGEQLEDISQCSLVDSLDSDSEEVKSRPSVAIVTHPADVSVEVPSDSDAGWSEPDLNVSKQRIGISDSAHHLSGRIHNTSEDESNRSFRKSPSVGKRSRSEAVLELRRLSIKLDSLEQVNEALQAEVIKLQKANTKVSGLLTPRALLERVRSQKKSAADIGEDIKKNKAFEACLIQEVEQLSSYLERSCRLCLELEERASAFEIERDQAAARATDLSQQVATLEERLASSEAERDEASSRIEDLSTRLNEAKEAHESAVKEHDNALLESQCSLLEANNQGLLLRAKIDSLTDTVADKQKVIVQLESELNAEKNAVRAAEDCATQSQLAAERLSAELESLQEKAKDEEKRSAELERRLKEAYDMHAAFRSTIDGEQKHTRSMEEHFKVEERGLRRLLAESESRRAELRHQLDAAVLTTSEAVLERTRLADDKMRLQRDLRSADAANYTVVKEYKRRIADLEAEVRDLEAGHSAIRRESIRSISIARSPPISPRSPSIRSPPISPRSLPASPPPSILLARQRSNPSSDYVSDQEHYYQQSGLWSVARSNNNSSPDLGIESDQHSLPVSQRHILRSLDPLPQLSLPPPKGDLTKLEMENVELRRELVKTRKSLEDTLSQLTSANQKKKQVEKAICKQLHKTHHILQKARVNLESDPAS